MFAVLLPAIRGPLCTAGAHEGRHGSDSRAVAAHEHGDAGAAATRGAPAGAPTPALARLSPPHRDCHSLMACGITLLAVHWRDAPEAPAPPVGRPVVPIVRVGHGEPCLGPALPPPRA